MKIIKTGRINSNQLQQVEIPYLKKLDKEVLANLNEALTNQIHATEMSTIDKVFVVLRVNCNANSFGESWNGK